MKKLTLFTITMVCFSLFSKAQITKGSVLLGGGISGSKLKTESSPSEGTLSTFAFNPAIGLAVKDNVVVGLRLSYFNSISKQDFPNNYNKQEQNGKGAALFYRKYRPLGKRFYLFGEGAAYYGYNRSTTEYTSSKGVTTNKNIGVNFFPGVAFAATKRIHLEIGLNNLLDISYGKSKTEYATQGSPGTINSSGFSIATNVSTATPLTVGFRIVLGN